MSRDHDCRQNQAHFAELTIAVVWGELAAITVSCNGGGANEVIFPSNSLRAGREAMLCISTHKHTHTFIN